MRRSLRSFHVRLMECSYAGAEFIWLTTNFVQREEAIVAIESRVFETLGHYRTAVLLGAHGHSEYRSPAIATLRSIHQIAA